MSIEEKKLQTIAKIEFEPLSAGEDHLTVTDFVQLKSLALEPGTEIELAGYVTGIGPTHDWEKDDSGYVACWAFGFGFFELHLLNHDSVAA